MSSRPTVPERPFRAVAILGLGAMGGSLARALSALPAPPDVAGWSPSEEEREAALRAGAVGRAPAAWEEAVEGAELVVVAAPLEASCRMIGGLADTTPTETLISDVASLKAPVARAVADAGAEGRWVGSHPMTGSEESGFEASRTDLYRDARIWTVHHAAASACVEPLHTLWRALGARPEAIDADEHDRLMALASQLPQLTANALAQVLSSGGVSPDRLGPGGADMTRLAASSAAMWRDIFEHASPELVAGLRSLGDSAARIADMLERGDLEGVERLMSETRAWSRPT